MQEEGKKAALVPPPPTASPLHRPTLRAMRVAPHAILVHVLAAQTMTRADASHIRRCLLTAKPPASNAALLGPGRHHIVRMETLDAANKMVATCSTPTETARVLFDEMVRRAIEADAVRGEATEMIIDLQQHKAGLEGELRAARMTLAAECCVKTRQTTALKSANDLLLLKLRESQELTMMACEETTAVRVAQLHQAGDQGQLSGRNTTMRAKLRGKVHDRVACVDEAALFNGRFRDLLVTTRTQGREIRELEHRRDELLSLLAEANACRQGQGDLVIDLKAENARLSVEVERLTSELHSAEVASPAQIQVQIPSEHLVRPMDQPLAVAATPVTQAPVNMQARPARLHQQPTRLRPAASASPAPGEVLPRAANQAAPRNRLHQATVSPAAQAQAPARGVPPARPGGPTRAGQRTKSNGPAPLPRWK